MVAYIPRGVKMPMLLERSLIKFGDGGCVISIPVAWLRYYGLGPGDKVEMIANGELIIRPKKTNPETNQTEK
jgi:antitoxin component of MazEF toxin-antitoxin module